jgi:hypothetical protein
MKNLVDDLASLLKPLPEDASPPNSPSCSYREAVSLQAIFVTLTIALLAYIQKDPVFHVRIDAFFVLLASIPLLGLFHIVRGRVSTPQGDLYLCARPVRAYARQALLFDLVIVGVVLCLHWQGQLPGQ